MNDRYLILMRHAKSSWSNASLPDFDRPLNERGRKSVPLIRNWLERNRIVPDCLLCSTACRTQQTAELMIDERSKPYSKIDLQELYLASPNTILEAIREHGSDSCQCLMVIGHNPGIEVLASMLAGRAIEMPTSAIAVFRLPSIRSWSIDFSEGLIELEHFIVPRALQPSLDSE